MLEKNIEKAFKAKLEAEGFKVVKFESPGTAGMPDRLIMFPKYHPQEPIFAEFKQGGQVLRPLQDAVVRDMIARGLGVLVVSGLDQANTLADALIDMVADSK